MPATFHVGHVRCLAGLCMVLSCGAVVPASAQELVTPVDVTSATSASDFFPVANLANNSGLSAAATLDSYTTVTHAAASGSTAWVTAFGGADYYAGDNPIPVLTCALDDTYELTDMVVWGYHFGNPNNNEAKDFTVDFSADGGITWSNPVSLSHGRTEQFHDTLSFGGTFSANAVRVTVTDNHFGAAGAGGGDRVGLGEIKFVGRAAPHPNPVIQVAGAVSFGSFTNLPPARNLPLPIGNAGDDLPLEIGSAEVIGAAAAHFSVAGLPLRIAAGGAGSLTVTFDALGVEGCFAATLEIRSNDPESLTNTVLLTASVNCPPRPLAPPLFSAPSGTFRDPFTLELATLSEGAFIIYTTDGTRPAETNGMLYTRPIPVASTVRIRAATLLPGLEPARASRSFVRIAPDLRSYVSGLPILIVENFGRGAIPDKGWTPSTQTGAGLQQQARQPSFMEIIDREASSGLASVLGPPHLCARIGIRVRGAFSSTWNPKPYSVESWDENDQDESIRPLGLPAESDWILYFPHPSYDRTMLYNTFIWELASETGRYGTRFRFVDVFINENGGELSMADRRGVYALAEKVKRDRKRIDFEALSEDGATGGWLLGINRMDPIPVGGFPAENGAASPQFFHTPGPNRIAQTPPNTSGQGDDIPRQYNAFINFESPNGYRINPVQRTVIENWFAEFENIFYDDMIWRDPVDGYRRYVNTRDVIDYFQLLNLGLQGDGLLLSIFPWVSSGERKLHMGPMWDFNNGAYGGDPARTLYFRQDRLWYPRFFQDPDFLREYIDRWFQLRRGPLANTNMSAIIDRQASRIPEALIPGQGLSVASWNGRLAAMESWLHQRADWIDQQYFRPPHLKPAGGIVISGSTLAMFNAASISGTIYFTLDGSDPLSTSPAVVPYRDPIVLTESVTVRARTRAESGEWSALNEGTFVVGLPATAENLVVSEIMYHPPDTHSDAEYLELLNIAPSEAIELTGVSFTNGIDFGFASGTTLGPGARILVVFNRSAFEAVYGTNALNIAGEFSRGRLDNGGETLRLQGVSGNVIQEFRYDDKVPWPEGADGRGFSLVLIAPHDNPDPARAENWRTSAAPGGVPGGSDAASFEGDPDGDSDGNGVPDLLDYFMGNWLAGDVSELTASVVAGNTAVFSYRRQVAADDVVLEIQVSEDLETWTEGSPLLSLLSRVPSFPGTAMETWQIQVPRPGRRFVRLSITQRPSRVFPGNP